MESAISKEQLDKLLINMQGSMSLTQVQNALKKASRFDLTEKNAFYHLILKTIVEANSPQQATSMIVSIVEELLANKSVVADEFLNGEVGSNSNDINIKSPLFRRVG